MLSRLKKLWEEPGGCREVLKIALPLIISTSAFALQMFIDRVFLMWHSSQAMSAAAYGGILSFTAFSLFLGTASYVNTFVAQYYGAGRKKRLGASVWQGLYFCIGAGLLMALFSTFGSVIVNWAGHDISLRRYEEVYFRILCIGAMPSLIATSLSCFYTGRGKTWTVMWVNVIASLINIALDYGLIFGNWGMPQMGVAGAALATVAAGIFSAVVYLILFFQKKYRIKFGTLSQCRFDPELFMRLMRYGLANGVQFMLDILGFTLFVTFVGRIGTTCFAASSMAFQINSLAFMPMIGFTTAVSTMVGQALGRGQPELAEKSTWSASYITFLYMVTIASVYLFCPDVFMYPFSLRAKAAEFELIRPIVKRLLIFVAFYSLFDTGNLIFSAALKGAGDTKFVMFASVSLNWLIMVIPGYIAIKLRPGISGLYWAWAALSAYVCVLAVLFLLRFLNGKWKSMRVIEAAPTPVPRIVPPVPTVEADMEISGRDLTKDN